MEFTGLIPTPANGFTLKVVYTCTPNSDYSEYTITADGYVKRNNSTYIPSSNYATASMTIDGNTKTLNGSVSYNLDNDNYNHIISHSKVVSMGSESSKTVNISLSFDGNGTTYYPNGSVSQNITLSRSLYTITYNGNGGLSNSQET